MGIVIVLVVVVAFFLVSRINGSSPIRVGDTTTPQLIPAGAIVTPTSNPNISMVQSSANAPAVTVANSVALTAPHVKPNATLLTDQQIAQMSLPSDAITSSGDRSRFISKCLAYLQIEIITDSALQSQCGGQGGVSQGPSMTLTTLKDGSLALSAVSSIGSAAGGTFGSTAGLFGTGFASAGSSIAQAIPIVGIAIGAAISILSAITAHHKQAVQREQGLECSLIGPVNQALQVIEQATNSGNITPQQAQSALSTLLSDFRAQATGGLGGLQEKHGTCNAMCWYAYFLKAIITKKQNRYAQYIN